MDGLVMSLSWQHRRMTWVTSCWRFLHQRFAGVDMALSSSPAFMKSEVSMSGRMLDEDGLCSTRQ